MSIWRAYETKRNAYERKHRAKVERALNGQLMAFIDQYKTSGNADTSQFNFSGIIGVLHTIYRDVGGAYAKQTAKELRSEAFTRQVAKGYYPAKGKVKYVRGLDFRTKWVRGLGFSEDWAKLIIDRLQASGLNLAQKISETTRKEVLMILQEGAKEGWSIDRIANEIVTRVKAMNARRAQTIARTEVGRAANEGKMIGAKSLSVECDKIWIGAKDHRERPSHLRTNDEQVPLDGKFKIGLRYPGDPEAPASEVCNCRCTLVFKVRKDAQGKPIPRVYMDNNSGVSIGSVLTQIN